MKNIEIKQLFTKADEQICVGESKKQNAYQAVLAEMEKQKIQTMPVKNILWQQFYYMDKFFFVVYGFLICFGVAAIAVLQHMGISQNEMITVCMAGAGILGIISILGIDRLFFGNMAELGASCYFNTKQCVAAWLVLSGMVDILFLFLTACYLNYHWKANLLQMGLYILTPYLISCIIALKVLSMEKREYRLILSGIIAAFLSAAYVVLGSVPQMFLITALWVWATAFFVSVMFAVIQIKKLLHHMQEGEVLCMN